MIEYILPFPISLNEAFVEVSKAEREIAKARGINLRGRKKSRAYEKWHKEAQQMIMAAGPRRMIEGPYLMRVELLRPSDARRRDLSNLAFKCVEDCLVSMRVIRDDSDAMEISARWVTQGPPCRVRISPYAASPNAADRVPSDALDR